ncbi:MAG TPA: dipeptidase PepE [Bacteroidales bacterium]|nr:dipeptidase PepE [Bacteroidales bacterium]
MKLLLISNSTNAGEGYLEHAFPHIKSFLGSKQAEILFIPYAAVTFSYDEYEKKVSQKFIEGGYKIKSIHHFTDPVAAIKKAEVIAVGGGNTWKLLKMIRENKLIEPVREKVFSGTPYIGWSAGANVACPTIRTTNDMPITEPDSFEAFCLIPFQINPHYLDANPEGFAGETREQRIREFIELNPGIYVAGLREGTMLLIEGKNVKLIGPKSARIFIKNAEPFEAGNNDDLSFLIQKKI